MVDVYKKDLYKNLRVLIVEPNTTLTFPYSYLPSTFTQHRVDSTKLALRELSHKAPSIAFISTSLSTHECLSLLEALKNASHKTLIPLILVIDLSNRINFVPGITWAGKIAFIDSKCTKKELDTVFLKVLKSKT